MALRRPRTQGTGPAGMNEPTFRMERPRTAEFFDRIRPRFIPDQGRPAPMPMPMPSPMPMPFPPMAPFMEQAAVDPSDYRTILKMIEAGLDPDDYMEANRGGIASLLR